MRSETDETEKRILEKAKRLFAEQGFYETNRTKIRIAAHVSEGTISTRFEDEELTPKEMVLVQILETCWRNINHLIESLPTTTDLIKRQKEILSIILDTFESDKELRIIFVSASREVHKLGARLMEGSVRKVVQAVESVFAKGQAEGIFGKHVSPKSMQRAFFGTVEEFLHSWVLRETRDYQMETSRQELERTIDSLLFGFSLSEESLKAIELTKKDSVEVYIYLPNVDVEEDTFLIDQVRDAVGSLMEAFDFELDPETQPIEAGGSWLTEIVFKRKGNTSTQAIKEMLDEIHEAGHLQAIDLAEAGVFEKRANAAANLLKQLEYVDEAVIRLGDVLFVKAKIDGKTRVVIENITPSLARELAKKPQLMHEPKSLISRIEAKITSRKKQLPSKMPPQKDSATDNSAIKTDADQLKKTPEDDLERVG